MSIYTFVLNTNDRVAGTPGDCLIPINHPDGQLFGEYEIELVDGSTEQQTPAWDIRVDVEGFRRPGSFDSKSGTETLRVGTIKPFLQYTRTFKLSFYGGPNSPLISQNTWRIFDADALFNIIGVNQWVYFTYAGSKFRLMFNPAVADSIRNTTIQRFDAGVWVDVSNGTTDPSPLKGSDWPTRLNDFQLIPIQLVCYQAAPDKVLVLDPNLQQNIRIITKTVAGNPLDVDGVFILRLRPCIAK